jgi:hypothetical protein
MLGVEAPVSIPFGEFEQDAKKFMESFALPENK